jgi:tetratricopeptide (TPR) repeat protein
MTDSYATASAERTQLTLRARARRAGLLYASGGIAAPFALLYVPTALFVNGDAQATAARIAASPGLLRMAIAAELVHCTLAIVAVLALYRLFRDVSQPLAAAMAALFLIAVPIELASVGNYAAALMLTSNASWLGAFTSAQLDALTYMSFRLHASGLQVAQVFWGVWLFPYGLVAMRSGFIPRWIGATLIAAGVGFVVASATALFFPEYLPIVRPVAALLMAGEVPMIVWLIGWGAREPKAPSRTATLAALALCLAFVPAALAAQTPLIDQGREAINRGDGDAAVSVLQKAAAESPQNAEAHYYLGKAFAIKAQQGNMFTAAGIFPQLKEAFERAVALNPKYVDARYALVEIYAGVPAMMGGSIDKAVEQTKALTPLDSTVAHRAYSFIYIQQKNFEQARQQLADAVREQPSSPRAHSYFGQYLATTEKNYPAALAEFDAALKADPSYIAALYHIGRAAALSGTNLARGEEALKRYVAYTPKPNEPTLANAHSQLGAVYEKEGKNAEARRSYQAALQLNPTIKDAADGLKRVGVS